MIAHLAMRSYDNARIPSHQLLSGVAFHSIRGMSHGDRVSKACRRRRPGVGVCSSSIGGRATTQRAPWSGWCLSHREEPDTSIPNFGGKLLVREILRQAILIAARDELGLSTYDMALREPMPEGDQPAVTVLDVTTAECLGQFVRVRLRQGTGEAAPLLYDKQIPLTLIQKRVLDYSGLITAVERLSRTEMVEALRKAGFARRADVLNTAADMPPEIGKRLAEMNYFSQFAALRELHALQATSVQSRQTLGGLVRGYANLGQMCCFHWNASAKAFRARSLLYAQRLVELDHGSAWSLRHCAYAKAFAGLHAAALEDLKAARDAAKKAGAKQPAIDDTPWEPLIEALCRYDRKATEEFDAGDQAELAAMVAFMIVEHSGTVPLVLAAGERAFDVIPECFWICDMLNYLGGVSLKHSTTVHGPRVLQEKLAERLCSIPQLPENVEVELEKQPEPEEGEEVDRAWSAGKSRPAIVRALAGSTDGERGEPSWEVLGRLIEDVTFVQVHRRLSFFYHDLGLPPDSYRKQLPAAYAMVEGHPYATVLKCSTADRQYYGAQIQELFGKLTIRDVDIPARELGAISWYGPSETETAGQRIWAAVLRHGDDVTRDLELLAEANNTPGVVFYPRVQVVSPHSPYGAALIIMELGDLDEKRYQKLEKDFGEHPIVLRNLGRRYLDFGMYDEAERVLKRSVEQCPDIKGTRLLAEVYWNKKDYDKWKDALDESLKHEDLGLAHAKVRVDIAKFLLEHDRLDEALSYADDAASTGAAWAMLCAADVHEAAGDLDGAEQLMQATARRYPEDRYKWFFWCRKTGHGDEDEARKLAMDEAEALSSSTMPGDFDLLGDIYVMLDKKDLARKAYQSALEAGDSDFIFSGLNAVVLADEAGHSHARDALLEILIQRIPRNFPTHLGLALWLKSEYSKPLDAEPDDATFEKLLEPAHVDDVDRVILRYLAARHYKHRELTKLVRNHLELCLKATYPARENTAFAMAGALLRELSAEKAQPTNK